MPQPGHLRDKAKKSGTDPAIPGRLVTMHVIASHVHEQYRECGNLPPVILEVKVVMNESLEMRGVEWTCEKENVTTDNCKLKCMIHVQCACVMRRPMRTCINVYV